MVSVVEDAGLRHQDAHVSVTALLTHLAAVRKAGTARIIRDRQGGLFIGDTQANEIGSARIEASQMGGPRLGQSFPFQEMGSDY
jgi:hypothetical protein